MLEAALQAEVETYIQRHCQERDENGHALVVRNGLAQERTVQCGAGQLKLKGPCLTYVSCTMRTYQFLLNHTVFSMQNDRRVSAKIVSELNYKTLSDFCNLS
jgi:hypothetical protein